MAFSFHSFAKFIERLYFVIFTESYAASAMHELQPAAIMESTRSRGTMECEKFKWIKYEPQFAGILSATIRYERHNMDEQWRLSQTGWISV